MTDNAPEVKRSLAAAELRRYVFREYLMSRMGELVNHLGISKSFVSAIFVTSVATIGGPFVLPDFVEPLQGLRRTGVIAAGIFYFTLIVAWILPPTIRAIASFPSKILHSTFWNRPNAGEFALLQ